MRWILALPNWHTCSSIRLTTTFTGGSAAAAGELVQKLGGETIGYLFILEIAFLKGREKLGGVPVTTLLETDE